MSKPCANPCRSEYDFSPFESAGIATGAARLCGIGDAEAWVDGRVIRQDFIAIAATFTTRIDFTVTLVTTASRVTVVTFAILASIGTVTL
ncbi:MAG: hypothetical protein QGF90_00825 [Gammaproteobacteria bacterium]|nr:hypothetical protein [Gammaproteobacteria bacterium]